MEYLSWALVISVWSKSRSWAWKSGSSEQLSLLQRPRSFLAVHLLPWLPSLLVGGRGSCGLTSCPRLASCPAVDGYRHGAPPAALPTGLCVLGPRRHAQGDGGQAQNSKAMCRCRGEQQQQQQQINTRMLYKTKPKQNVNAFWMTGAWQESELFPLPSGIGGEGSCNPSAQGGGVNGTNKVFSVVL